MTARKKAPALDAATLRMIAEELWSDEDAARVQAKNAATAAARAPLDAVANKLMSLRRSLRDRATHIERAKKASKP